MILTISDITVADNVTMVKNNITMLVENIHLNIFFSNWRYGLSNGTYFWLAKPSIYSL